MMGGFRVQVDPNNDGNIIINISSISLNKKDFKILQREISAGTQKEEVYARPHR